MSTAIEPARPLSPPTTPALVINEDVLVPGGIVDLESFRRWAHSEEDRKGFRASWLGGEVWLEVPDEPLHVDERQIAAVHAVMAAPIPVPYPAGANGQREPTAPRIIINERVRIPAGVVDLESFQNWASTLEDVKDYRVAFLAGVIWIDLTMEQAYTHNDVKSEATLVLRGLAKREGQGRYFGDGMSLENPAAGLSTVPDGLYFSFASANAGRVQQVQGQTHGVVIFRGTPDMVLEVVSDSSVEKDTVRLPQEYRLAGIPELWRIDARGELRFEIFELTPAGYAPTQGPDGWWRSPAFGRSFRMTSQPDPLGHLQVTLEVR
jgi:Uma2 family endonuclease